MDRFGIWQRRPIAFAIVIFAMMLYVASAIWPRLKPISELADFVVGIMGLGLLVQWVWKKMRARS